MNAAGLLWILAGVILASVGIALLREQRGPWQVAAVFIGLALCACLEAHHHGGSL